MENVEYIMSIAIASNNLYNIIGKEKIEKEIMKNLEDCDLEISKDLSFIKKVEVYFDYMEDFSGINVISLHEINFDKKEIKQIFF